MLRLLLQTTSSCIALQGHQDVDVVFYIHLLRCYYNNRERSELFAQQLVQSADHEGMKSEKEESFLSLLSVAWLARGCISIQNQLVTFTHPA